MKISPAIYLAVFCTAASLRVAAAQTSYLRGGPDTETRLYMGRPSTYETENPRSPQRPSPRQQLERIEHLRIAAENLSRAGLEQEAERLRQRASAIERELAPMQSPPGSDALARELHELRFSLNQLREEVHALRMQLRSRESDLGDRPANEHPAAGQKGTRSGIHEGHIRLPDRGSRISDEELDAAPASRQIPYLQRSSKKASPDKSSRIHDDERDFELVPVPVENDEALPIQVPITSEKLTR